MYQKVKKMTGSTGKFRIFFWDLRKRAPLLTAATLNSHEVTLFYGGKKRDLHAMG